MRRTLRSRVARGVLGAARTPAGQRLVQRTFELLLQLTVDLAPEARFTNVRQLPDRLRGFEDLSFLFTPSRLEQGIAQLTTEEAAFLYRTARDAETRTLVEIGRYKGGGTLVIAAAMPPEASLVSYDLHAVPGADGEQLDAELRSVLERYGLADRVRLVVADSRSAPPVVDCGLVFVDGDHTYEGVRGDYEHWKRSVSAGGHLLFHDVPDPGNPAEPGSEPVGRAVAEIERTQGAYFRRASRSGSIVAFVRTEAPFDDETASA